jgi:hypothetical protein
MALNMFSATRLANRLGSDAVDPREQAYYLVIGALAWLVVGYLPVIQALTPAWASRPYGPLESWSIGPLGLWLYEFVLLTVINVVGVFYCLTRCRVDPKRNFLVDFSCLSAPINVTTSILVWGVFHIYASVVPWWLQFPNFESQPKWVDLFYSFRFLDLMRFLATVAASFLIFFRIGAHMERVSSLRESGNAASQGTLASEARSDP